MNFVLKKIYLQVCLYVHIFSFQILVHEVPTYEPGHYNEFSPEGVAWNVQDLLEVGIQ